MFAPKPLRRGEGDGARDPAGRPDRDGQLDSGRSDAGGADPEDQLRVHAAAARGVRQPDDVGHREPRDRAIRRRGSSSGEDLFVRDTYTFNYPGSPRKFVAEFRNYYGPTMNAFDAAEKSGRAAELQKELEELFDSPEPERPRGVDLHSGDLLARDRCALIKR